MTDQRRLDETAYRTLAAELFARGYEVAGYGGVDPAARQVVWRHDVDLSLDYALEVARWNADLGIAATFFVMVSNPFYNLFEASAKTALRDIAALGQSVGLHFDASVYEPEGLDAGAAREAAILADVLGGPVEMLSFHRPARHLIGTNEPVGGLAHAYMPRYFSDMGYSSDSRGAWHHGHPLDHAAVGEGRALQLLTHPVWWVLEGETAADKLKRFVATRLGRFETDLADNIEPYRALIGTRTNPLW